MDFAFLQRSLPVLVEGVELTLMLAVVSIAGAATGGFVVMAARRSGLRPIRGAAIAFIEAMRNTPIMVQIFVLYFSVPSIGVAPSAFTCAVIALVLQNSAYVGEIYRAGVDSVHRTQTEAALALGMRRREALRSIVMPQALRRVLPVLGSQTVVVLKDTSIASTISVAELTHTGKLLLDRSAAPYETFLAVGLLYLVLSALLLGGMRIVAACFPVRA
jgi:His/Glu/Gln/Arg/opine family amino acid ABC transporter permease subunit